MPFDVNPLTGRPGPAPQPPRDGDKLQATSGEMSKKADQVAQALTILAPGDCVRVKSCAPSEYQGRVGRITERLRLQNYDFLVELDADDDYYFYADELELVNES